MEQDMLLAVDNLRISFKTHGGELTAVDGISFGVRRGELLGILGESGCGKSVSALSVMGLVESPGVVRADSIRFDGEELVGAGAETMRRMRGSRMSMIFQEPLTSLNPLFTVGFQIREQILAHENVSKAEARAKSIEMLRKTGIPNPEAVYGRYPNALSGGMRQRVMIAIALACNPQLLIADEPTTALDVTIQAQILELMKQLMREYGTSIMFITHDLGVVAEMADRVLVMYAGQVVEQADVMTLFHAPQHPYTMGLLGSTIRIQDENTTLQSIEGAVPSLANMPGGCRFHPRCPQACERCREQSPELRDLGGGHMARCFIAEQKGGLQVG